MKVNRRLKLDFADNPRPGPAPVRDNRRVILVFGDYELDTALFELRWKGQPRQVEPQVFDVLRVLAVSRDRVVSKDELLDTVWGDRFVSEAALTTRIKAARRAVGDDGSRQQVIRTVHGRGYRFVAPIVESAGPPAGPGLPKTETLARAQHPRQQGVPAGGKAVTDPWPLIGRSAELAALADALAEASADGVLLIGSAGVGKTRLAEECLRLADSAGVPIARATGHPEAGSLPLAGLSHLLPIDIAELGPDGELSRVVLFHRARAAFEERAAGHRLLLLIDDADRLDPMSLTLVSSLVTARTVFAMLTTRARPQPGASIERLVHDGHLRRIELGPLDDASVEALLHRVLGGPLVADSLQELIATCQGNPGILRQLVESAIQGGVLVEHHGVWRLNGHLQATPTLEGLVDERIRDLAVEDRAAMEILAVAGSIGHDLFAGLVGEEVVHRLDEHALVAVRNSGRRCDLAVAHPVYAEVLRARLPRLRSRRIRYQLAEALETVGARRREDGVRIISWRLDGGGHVEAPQLVRAARLALLQRDLTVAERLARRAYDDSELPEAVQVLSEVHYRRGEFEQMEELLERADVARADDRLCAELARRRANGLFYGLGLLEEPLAVLDRALQGLTEPTARQTIESHRAMVLAFGGLVSQAIAATDRLPAVAAAADRFEVLRARTLALAMAGRGEDAILLAAEGRALHAELETEPATPGLSVLLFSQATALTELGRFRDARSMIEDDLLNRPEATTRNWLRIARARLELATGHVRTAQEAIAPVVTEGRGMALGTVERWGLVLLTMTCLLNGEMDAAQRHLHRARTIRVDPPRSAFSYDSDRAEAWMMAATGAVAEARNQLLAAAERARRDGVAAHEAALLHDVVRFGDGATVSERLSALARTTQGKLIALRAGHAQAIAHGDVEGLDRVSRAFEQLDSPLWAAETAAQLAHLSLERGDDDTADAAARRAQDLSGRTGNQHPALTVRRPAPLLSAREREVATLAADGLSSRAIAERLYLSVRTVENHLQRSYAKLGVKTREQLAETLTSQVAPTDKHNT
jgi:DNA-binding winged helix-turn-helix (wHTH) protein/DNA-binding CsgD family transcriptional regulator